MEKAESERYDLMKNHGQIIDGRYKVIDVAIISLNMNEEKLRAWRPKE